MPRGTAEAVPYVRGHRLGKRQRHVFGRVVPRTDGHHDVLLAFQHVGHRAARGPGRQLGFPDHATGRFVVRAELPAPPPFRLRSAADGIAAFSEEQQRPGQQWRGTVRDTERWQIEGLQQRVIAGAIAVGGQILNFTSGDDRYYLGAGFVFAGVFVKAANLFESTTVEIVDSNGVVISRLTLNPDSANEAQARRHCSH